MPTLLLHARSHALPILLLPHLTREGLALDRLGCTGIAAIIMGCGAPMVLLVNAGLLFAPAAHGGALFPGVMPLMVAILAVAVLKEPFTPQKSIGLALIVIGAIGIVWGSGGTIGTTQNRFLAHLLRRRPPPTSAMPSRSSHWPHDSWRVSF
jgi:drug/metabolite transporter (DMT)-like permease